MAHGNDSLARFYQGWHEYQELLVEAIRGLTPRQLALAAAPEQRPIWLMVAHIIGTRVGWFQRIMDGIEPELVAYDVWDAEGAAPRSAAELVEGLATTWGMIERCLTSWTPAMLDDTIVTPRGRTVTRQWVIWHVIEHDLHHGGEVSLTLGIHGLPAPDL